MSDEQAGNGDAVALLNAALAAAQGEFLPIPRDKTVTVKTRDGASYEFAYAPLDTILEKCRPALANHGLSIIQLLDVGELGGPVLRTQLRHKNGAVVESAFPFTVPGSPQQLGSLLTYLRRYTLTALLGVAAEEDDDGQQAADQPPAPKQQPRPAKPSGASQKPPLATAAQKKQLFAMMDEAGFATGPGGRGARLAYTSRVIDRQIESSNELTMSEARKVADDLQAIAKMPPGDERDRRMMGAQELAALVEVEEVAQRRFEAPAAVRDALEHNPDDDIPF